MCARTSTSAESVRCVYLILLAEVGERPAPFLLLSWAMPTYEDLDAFKACHALTLAVRRVNEKFEDRDPELAGQLMCGDPLKGHQGVVVFPDPLRFKPTHSDSLHSSSFTFSR